jgi:hypothetical protein
MLRRFQAEFRFGCELAAARRGDRTRWEQLLAEACAHVLEVRAEVIRVMEVLKPGGGYVCSPDQNIPGVPEENMRALWETAREEGRY